MDTHRFTGQEFQNVRVKIAGPDFESTCKLEVSAISQTDVVIKPGRVSFGSIERGAAPSQTIDIEYLGQLDWKVEEVVVAKELPFTTVLNEPATARPGLLPTQGYHACRCPPRGH